MDIEVGLLGRLRIVGHLLIPFRGSRKVAPSPAGKDKWQTATVRSILQNEKYKGDALLQKGFTVDFLTKRRKVNEGKVPQYYVQNSHPAIIAPDEFDMVQAEIERRKKLGRLSGCGSPFTAKIICGDCGGFYGSKVWGSNTKYRRIIWRCNDKYKGDTKCVTRHVTEDEVKKGFLTAFNKLLGGREELTADCRLAQSALCDCSAIDAEVDELRWEIEVVTELSRKAICENARVDQSQEDWSERNNSYLERHRRATERIAELDEMKRARIAKGLRLEAFIWNLATCPLAVDEFDERLWVAAVDIVTVAKDERLVFQFKDGTEA